MPILDWRNRHEALRAAAVAPLRALVEVPELAAGEPGAENLLVHGDNLDALKALLPFAAGQVKCIYIDPPYNTGSAFEHYDDKLEHSTWLSLMYPRLELLRQFLTEDGSIWISIDDDEQAYLKVVCDEIFGRQNFMGTITWQRAYSPIALAKNISRSTDFILAYAKNKDNVAWNRLSRTEEANKRYKNLDNDPRGPWKTTDSTAQAGHGTESQFYDFIAPNGKVHKLPPGRCWLYTQQAMAKMIADNRVWFGKDGNNVPAIKRFLHEVSSGIVPQTLWPFNEVGHTQESKKEILAFKFDTVFDTPKPERLIQRILQIATDEGDLVLDSFLGSGTTAAVAHKMGRRWIGVEMGEHARTHCAVRLRKVVEGEQGGISKAEGWKGGGGFRYLELGEVLRDETGAVRREVSWDVLAAHVWWTETKTGFWTADAGRLFVREGGERSPVLGVHGGTAYALLFNGILKDRRVNGGNVLTRRTLALLRGDLARRHPGEKVERLVVFAEWSRLGAATLEAEGIELRQTASALPAGAGTDGQEDAPCN